MSFSWESKDTPIPPPVSIQANSPKSLGRAVCPLDGCFANPNQDRDVVHFPEVYTAM